MEVKELMEELQAKLHKMNERINQLMERL